MENHERCPDEETPLLQKRSKTPLPWNQLCLVFLALIAEPLSSAYIFPFINQLISELGITGGDDRKIGYYAGLIESLFFVTQALTTFRWSRLSDFIGRRPIILIGLLGLSLSNFAFGLSRTFVTLIVSRCIAGVLNGNIGVMKSMVGDITDHTNMADAFAIIPAIFCVGATIAPLYGGALANPQERWPHIFRGGFWVAYPYFLPSFVSACAAFLIFISCATFMMETLPSKTCPKSQSEGRTTESLLDDPPTNDERHDEQPIPMFTLLTMSSVMIPIFNYGTLALVEIALLALFPLFYSSPIAIGGLGFSPSIIGTFLATFGIVDGLVQALFAARILKWVGPKKLFCWAVLWFYPLLLTFPVMSAVVKAQGKVGPIIWILLILQLIFMVLMDLSYTVISIFTTKAAPNKSSLGSTNGISQSLTSVARAIGPALATSLFAASKEYNILGGNLVYITLGIVTTILVLLSHHLPESKDE